MNKKIISLLMVVCMFVTLLTGCGSKVASSTKSDAKKTDGKITVTDMLGREVTVNGTPKKVLATGGALRLYCYVGSKDKLVGVEQSEKDSSKGKPYMLANPALAGLTTVGEGGDSSGDYEKILAVKPDVIFTVSDDKAIADNLQSKTGIPVVALDYGKNFTFDSKTYSSLKLIGKIIGEDKRANEVVDYIEKCKKDLNTRTKDIPDDKKPSTYVGALAHGGSHGIESTQGKYPLFEMLNAKNVADETGKTGRIMIDKEKLIQWNPDKIFIDLSGLKLVQEDYKKNPDFYKSLKAFKNGEIYSELPYVWYWVNVDTAIADTYYIGKALYPDKFKDINPERKADEIYKFLLGKEVYSQMVKDYCGGFKKITLEELGK